MSETNGTSAPAPLARAQALPREVEEGNVEYKLKLVAVQPDRLEHLTTQLHWRLNEGRQTGADGASEAYYEIGTADDGFPQGLSDADFDASLRTLECMARAVDASTEVVSVRQGQEGKVVKVRVRRELRGAKQHELRMALIGDAGAGKSTLAAVLSTGELDNGRGLARMQVLRHNHEFEDGRTSSISHVVLGFDTRGEVVNYNNAQADADVCCGPVDAADAAELLQHASKLVTVLDMPGHPKYLKTALAGLIGHLPDYVLLAVDAQTAALSGGLGLGTMSREHLDIAVRLGLPAVVVVTKTDDATAEQIDTATDALCALLASAEGGHHRPVVVHDRAELAAACLGSPVVVPILVTSAVTGAGLPLLQHLLFSLPASPRHGRGAAHAPTAAPPTATTLVRVDDSFRVDEVGLVLAGTLHAGTVSVGEVLHLGPDADGLFHVVRVSSIHVNRVAAKLVVAGQSATFAIAAADRPDPHSPGLASSAATQRLLAGSMGKRRGMVLLAPSADAVAVYEFDAEVEVLRHPHAINVHYEPVVHVHTVAQCARITAMVSDDPADTLPPPSGRHPWDSPPRSLRHKQQQHGGGGGGKVPCGQSGGGSSSAEHKPEPEPLPDVDLDAFKLTPAAVGGPPVPQVPSHGPPATVLYDKPQPAKAGGPPSPNSAPLRAGQKAKIRFRFMYKPEYVLPGDAVVFREGCTRGFGRIIHVHG